MENLKFNEIINVFERANNCQKALSILKYIAENGQWWKDYRKKYPLEDIDLWYKNIKESIDECIKLIETNADKPEAE